MVPRLKYIKRLTMPVSTVVFALDDVLVQLIAIRISDWTMNSPLSVEKKEWQIAQ